MAWGRQLNKNSKRFRFLKKPFLTGIFYLHFFFFFKAHERRLNIIHYCCFCLVPVVSNSLWPHGLQHARLPCPSLSPRICSNSCPLSRWCHPNVASCRPLLLLPSIFSSIRVFSSESAVRIRWPNYWSFSMTPSNEYSRLISFWIDWFDFLAVQGTLKSLLQHHNLKAPIPRCSALFMIQLSHPYMFTHY